MTAADVERLAALLGLPLEPGSAAAIAEQLAGYLAVARLFTQPLSFVGLPVISVPVAGAGPLPLGVQLVAAPFMEAKLFRVAACLEADGVVAATVASARD